MHKKGQLTSNLVPSVHVASFPGHSQIYLAAMEGNWVQDEIWEWPI